VLYAQLTVDGLAHVLCMTELLDKADACRHLANRRQPGASIQPQSSTSRSSPWCEHRPPAAPPSQRRHYIADCRPCTLHGRQLLPLCRRQPGISPSPRRTCSRRLERDVTDISRYLRRYLGRLDDAEQRNRVARDWRLVARLLDRLFFFMYVSTITVSLATIFPKGGPTSRPGA